jgi:NADH-quinone oxidoreductase subunit G
VVTISPALAARLGVASGAEVRVAQGGGSAVLPVRVDSATADNVVRVPAGHPLTATLGAMFGPIAIDKA